MKSSVQLILVQVRERKQSLIQGGRKILSNVNAKRYIKTDMDFGFLCPCSFEPDFRELVELYGKIRKPPI